MNDREITMLVNSLVDRDEWDAVECIRALKSRLESLKKDAARYRWLRDSNAYEPEEAGVIGGIELDDLIDAAMQANKGD